MEMRLVPPDIFLSFSTLSSALQAVVVQRARRSLRGQSFAGILATHDGAKMYILRSIVSRSMAMFYPRSSIISAIIFSYFFHCIHVVLCVK